MDASGASSSTAADPINSSSHGVFINHRGPDTKKTFASYLYRRLLIHGFKPFLDQQELEEGSHFPSQIVGAIRSAGVHLAIFSPTYAHSQWCLHELVLMLESKAPIIPIFYNVDPADFRWEKGVYAEALHKLQMKKTLDPQTHEEKPRYDSATLQKWRKALSDVADISGFDLKGKFNGDEGLLLDEVVKRVVKIMAKKTQLYVAKNPTGLDDKVADFETTVLKQQNTGDVQVVGIVGLGGVGKTSLAKEFFNRKRSEYSQSYFLSDVRENAKSSLHSLQSELLKGLFGLDVQIVNIHQGTELLRQYLSSSKVFLILDDIDHMDQVDALLPDRNALDKDSLILITSRDEGVLASSGVKESCMYKLTGLPEQHSRELFCLYAFCQPYPQLGFEHVVNRFLMACAGLPLSLTVFGALLSGYHEISDWKAILHRFKLPNDIKHKLKISYDKLSEEEQQIFLDIACFFIGKNKNSAITVWNASSWQGSLGFRNLQLKCLAKVDDRDVIHMHDHLRDMGREIAETQLPLRLWRPTAGNIKDWLHRQSSVIMEARGIRLLQGYGIQRLPWYQRWSHQMLGSSVNLHLVETKGHALDCILRVRSPNLIWLSWRYCPYKYLPSWITMKNLRVLRVEGGQLETLWLGKSQAPLQLQELEIIDASCLSSIPKSIGQLKHLERILIESLSLAKLPEEFGDLNSLKDLVLSAGTMKLLPNSFGKLRNLYHMDLFMCHQLERLPDSFCSLWNLHSLDLNCCQKLESLPDSFGSLSNLHNLDLNQCQKLERLPDSFGSLSNLHSLDLNQCAKLERLLDSFGSLSNLHSLDLNPCQKLERLPDSFGSLSNLHSLDLNRCQKLERLPDSFGSLSNLHSLDLSECLKLERLSDSFGSLSNLHILNLSECEKLERLSDSFGSLSNLHSLDLKECFHLERLPDSFGSLSNLHSLDLNRCRKLERLPDSLGSLSNLHSLNLSLCAKLERLPDSLGSLSNLHSLDLQWCRQLEKLPDSFGSLSNLHSLDMSRCKKLERLPDSFSRLSKLHSLDLQWCSQLKKLPDSFGSLSNLHSLDMSNCKKLERLPDSFSRLSKLHSLNLSECEKLERLSDSFGSLSNLHSLDLKECLQLERLPDSFGSLSNLHKLDLCGCKKLERLPDSFGSLSSLEYFNVSQSANLRISTDTFGNIRTLEHVDFEGCEKVEVWPWQLAHQRSLKVLKLTGTNFKKELPSAFELPRALEVLWIGNPLLDTVMPNSELPRALEVLWIGNPLLDTVMPNSLGDLQNLKDLRLEFHGELKCLSASVERSSELSWLKVSGCPIIHTSEVFYDNVVYPKLKKLIFEECINLAEVETLPKALTQVTFIGCDNLRSVEGLCGLPRLQLISIERCNELQVPPNVEERLEQNSVFLIRH